MIAIKGMKMPKGCDYCQFRRRHTYERSNYAPSETIAMCYAKTIHGRRLPRSYNIDAFRPQWCPLIEVKGGEGVNDETD